MSTALITLVLSEQKDVCTSRVFIFGFWIFLTFCFVAEGESVMLSVLSCFNLLYSAAEFIQPKNYIRNLVLLCMWIRTR